MNRPLVIIATVLFILAVVFHFAAIAGNFVVVLIAVAGLLLSVGVLTGR